MKKSIKTIGLLTALALGLTSPLFSQVPDITKDTKSVDRTATCNLGATGLRGWIYTKAENNLDAAQGRTTGASRQILVTHDGEILPTIKHNALSLARGQSAYGTFGHGYASLTKDRSFNGSAPPYGPVNSAGLPANLSLVLSKKCGVGFPEVDQAIVRAAGFFGYYTDEGAVSYGEHKPWPYHENNGKNATTAVMFGAMGDKPKETAFFARMALAAYPSREYGHTGQGFSYLWSALGANVAGPEAAAAFFRNASWHLDPRTRQLRQGCH